MRAKDVIDTPEIKFILNFASPSASLWAIFNGTNGTTSPCPLQEEGAVESFEKAIEKVIRDKPKRSTNILHGKRRPRG